MKKYESRKEIEQEIGVKLYTMNELRRMGYRVKKAEKAHCAWIRNVRGTHSQVCLFALSQCENM